MARALSQELRDRVVSSIESGLSCRRAAARIEVGVATAIRWRQLALCHGRAVAKPQGRDRLSSRIEVQAGFIFALVDEQGDITLAETREKLAECGTPVGIGTVWRFFARHRITRKKRPRTLSSRIVPTS